MTPDRLAHADEDVPLRKSDHRHLGDLVDLGPIGAARERQPDERQAPIAVFIGHPPQPGCFAASVRRFAESRGFDNAGGGSLDLGLTATRRGPR